VTRAWRVSIAVLGLLGASLYWWLAIPGSAVPEGAASRARIQSGPREVVQEKIVVVDTSRPTRANGDFPGADSRTLRGRLWRPARRETPGPLLIYSHGFMSYHREGLYLARFLASHGYTVVAVDYPLTTTFAPGGPLLADVVNQPGDVSFLIDTLLARSAAPADPLHGTIDFNEIAVAGVSLGGLTSTLATFHGIEHDPRIDAAVNIAGPATMLGEAFFMRRSVPYLAVYADADAIVPYEDNVPPLLRNYPATILVTLRNASHTAFAQPAATLLRFMDNPDALGCRAVLDNLGDGLPGLVEEVHDALGGAAQGMALDGAVNICAAPLPPRTMRAARQHMFTTLAVHAFLESRFGDTPAARRAARHYLLSTLADESGGDVQVTKP